MPDTYTGTAGIANQTGMTNLVQTAYDRYVEMALRSQPLIRSIADKRPVQQAMPGSSVVFQIYADLAQATSTLTENVDPDAVALSNTSTVTVTLNEYGNAALLTRKLGLFSLSDIDPAAADIIAYNMADSLDSVVMTELRGGTHVRYATGGASPATATVETATDDKILLADIRYAVAKLRARLAVPRSGSLYHCYIHPEVSHDLRANTASGEFQDLHKYDATENFWPGFIGTIEGAAFIETPRMYNALDGAGAAVRVFRTILVGKQALAEATAEEPHVIVGPVTDKLMRHRPLGWYGVLGWKRYREASLFRIESTSTINSGA
jgi:N4-gp56 family major capsid protein